MPRKPNFACPEAKSKSANCSRFICFIMWTTSVGFFFLSVFCCSNLSYIPDSPFPSFLISAFSVLTNRTSSPAIHFQYNTCINGQNNSRALQSNQWVLYLVFKIKIARLDTFESSGHSITNQQIKIDA